MSTVKLYTVNSQEYKQHKTNQKDLPLKLKVQAR
jgi:hypothetical protein